MEVVLGTSGQSSPWDLLMLELGAAMPKSIDHQMICFLALWLLEHGPWPTCGTKVLNKSGNIWRISFAVSEPCKLLEQILDDVCITPLIP
jgi:hypothetical protein